MSLVVWLVLGLALGLVAGLFGRSPDRGVAASIMVGMLGALIGGGAASVLRDLDVNQVHLTSLLLAGFGSVLLIGLLWTLPPIEAME